VIAMIGTTLSRRRRRIAGFVTIAAVVGLLVGLLAGPVLAGVLVPGRTTALVPGATDQTPEHTIAVVGSGKVTVVPDEATVQLGVVVEKPTAKAARDAAAAAMTKVVAAFKALGIDERDIATSNVSLGPVYDYAQGSTPKIRGYQLQNAVTVTVRKLDVLSDVLDDAVTAGATSVNGVSFDVADRAAAEANARSAAVKDAKAKADTLAAGVGVRITGVASMSEQVSTPIWYNRSFSGATAAPDAASTPVLPGTTDVTITVSVTFLIG
jgi:uncharacterized protein YggE